MKFLKRLMALFVMGLAGFMVASCATFMPQSCPDGTQNLPDCPPLYAVDDPMIGQLYESRAWQSNKELKADSDLEDKDSSIPINQGYAKVIGPTYQESVTSLALKLWMIDQAQHTIDLTYYIFAKDKVGYAIIGSLCNAVKRGVDIRIMVDSLGALRPLHNELKALQTCQQNAAFIRNAEGQTTIKKARVQASVINALSKLQFNRRSHDKLMIVDGKFPDKAMILTGGRNISLDYYGIYEDGSVDPTAFRDVEVFVRDELGDKGGVGATAEEYFTKLFLHRGNKVLSPSFWSFSYDKELKKSNSALSFLKDHADIKPKIEGMSEFLDAGLVPAELRLAHQLGNLSRDDAVNHHIEFLKESPNAIGFLMAEIVKNFLADGELKGTLRIVSPYLFLSEYPSEKGDKEFSFDVVKLIHKLLKENPSFKIEILTNSVLTSDNAFTQSFIDIGMIPRLFFDESLSEKWKGFDEKNDDIAEIFHSEEWQAMLSHPRLSVYQTGGLDSNILGGDKYYGKLHAKFIYGSTVGFIGTSNFDYRSNIYNNEVGFFYRSEKLSNQLDTVYEDLLETSYQWGSAEWLEMRRKTLESKTAKAVNMKNQRFFYKTLKVLGLEYLI